MNKCYICGRKAKPLTPHEVYSGAKWELRSGPLSKRIPLGKTSGFVDIRKHVVQACKRCEVKWGKVIPGIVLLPIPLAYTALLILTIFRGGPSGGAAWLLLFLFLLLPWGLAAFFWIVFFHSLIDRILARKAARARNRRKGVDSYRGITDSTINP
jgi:hypothetical protein